MMSNMKNALDNINRFYIAEERMSEHEDNSNRKFNPKIKLRKRLKNGISVNCEIILILM